MAQISVPYRSLVQKADPSFDRDRRRQLEYQFSNGRDFYADPNVRGAFNPDDQPVPPEPPPILPPVTVMDAVTTAFETPIVIAPLFNDTDPQGLPLTVVSVSLVGTGTATTNGTTVLFTPTSGFFGVVTINYVISNGVLTANGVILVTVTEEVVSPPDPPIAAFGGIPESSTADGTSDEMLMLYI